MAFPTTLDEARAAGYVFLQHRTCKGPRCQKTIEFWRTPRGKFMPFDVDDKTGAIVPHWSTCVDAGEFHK